MIQENERRAANGVAALIVLLGALLSSGLLMLAGIAFGPAPVVLGMIGSIVSSFCLAGLFVVNPNEAKVLQLFGRYVGTVKNAGLHWASPFFMKHPVSLRIMSFETGRLKVNDVDGNPIEIAAVV